MMDVAEQEYMKQPSYLLLYNQGYAGQYQPYLLIIVVVLRCNEQPGALFCYHSGSYTTCKLNQPRHWERDEYMLNHHIRYKKRSLSINNGDISPSCPS